ncbi:hypothetical protein [Vibrio harveyi]|uniref:hypothetical protein n=1 Tax=Vibrio harveyi TaxID=669 RepID=UPI00390A2E8D
MTTHKQDVKTHTPEGWTILRFQNPQKEPFYKVFATWRQNDIVEKGLAHGVQITEIALSDVPGLPNEVRVKL